MSAWRMGRLRVVGVAIASCLGLGLLGAGSASAETKTFATHGCEAWEVPAGVTSVAIQATGAAGSVGLAAAASSASPQGHRLRPGSRGKFGGQVVSGPP